MNSSPSVAPASARRLRSARPPPPGVPVTCVGEAVEGYGPPRFIGPDGGPVTFRARLLQPLLKDTARMTDADPMQMRLLAAEAVAREAGALARRRFLDSSFKVGFKGPQDYLTEVDGETEELISARLARSLSA